MRRLLIVFALIVPAAAAAQQPPQESGFIHTAKRAYETLFTKPIRLSLDSIAPGSGIPAGIGFNPKPWQGPNVFKFVEARASLSQYKYWQIDGSVALQGVREREWRFQPYARFRDMKRLNFYGLGNESAGDRTTFSLLDRRAGAVGYVRPIGLIAVGARAEGVWPRTSSGEDPGVPSVEVAFSANELPGFADNTNYVYAGGFVNLNYPYSRSEPPRRGGDYLVSLGAYHDYAGTGHSFTRFEVEGRERFPIAGVDRALAIHGRLSSSRTDSDQTVPFYMMDTLGGADNLRGFRESIIGGDEATSTLRSYDSFRFRDRTTALMQIDFRQRIWAQVFATVFVDAGVVAPTIGSLSLDQTHYGVGAGVSVYRTNALAVRIEVALFGGEGHPYYVTSGRGLKFQ